MHDIRGRLGGEFIHHCIASQTQIISYAFFCIQPNGAKCTEEVKSSAQTGFAACTTGTCGKEFETALTCIYKAIKSECPKTPLCLETTLTSSDSVLALN